MSASEATLPIYLVALQKSRLLLPASAVAEIIPYEPLQRIGDTPDWFVGILGWRGVQVPVVSFETLTFNRGSFSLVSVSSASLVILRTLRTRDDLPFYAIVAQAVPELLQLSKNSIDDSLEEIEETELAKAKIGENIVSVPDLEYLEASINEVPLSLGSAH